MKIGFIVECGPEGAETKVIPHLAKMARPAIETDVVPLGDKPTLKKTCGRWAKTLLARGCGRVLIVWDLLPAWREYEGKGCRHDDKAEIHSSLKLEGLQPTDQRIRLVCIEKMLEAWLIADDRAVGDLLSTAAHSVPIQKHKNPESIKDPKAALNSLFQKSKSRIRRYEDRTHAIEIARRMKDLTRLRKLASFAYFMSKL